MRFFYNLFFPLVFLFFLPALLYKLKHRPGWKSTYRERFGFFSKERKKELSAWRGAIWIHAVSVGETMIALSLLQEYRKSHPERRFILSSTTTTGQQLARDKAPENTRVIFCPIDFYGAVRRTLRLLQPQALLILETELWPNLIYESAKRGMMLGLLNGRMSDHSARGYRRFRCFFGRLLAKFDFILVQSAIDLERYKSVSYRDNVQLAGNMKFDQKVPAQLAEAGFANWFGPGEWRILLAASTHPGEEKLIAQTWLSLKKQFPMLKLVLVPRHAERGGEVFESVGTLGISACRKSLYPDSIHPPVDCLIADTTGEMLKLMNGADIVIMGKSLAGHDEGHNLIEPALLSKPICCGAKLRNFRHLLELLKADDALAAVESDDELESVLAKLLADPEAARAMGGRGYACIGKHAGAIRRTMEIIETTLHAKTSTEKQETTK